MRQKLASIASLGVAAFMVKIAISGLYCALFANSINEYNDRHKYDHMKLNIMNVDYIQLSDHMYCASDKLSSLHNGSMKLYRQLDQVMDMDLSIDIIHKDRYGYQFLFEPVDKDHNALVKDSIICSEVDSKIASNDFTLCVGTDENLNIQYLIQGKDIKFTTPLYKNDKVIYDSEEIIKKLDNYKEDVGCYKSKYTVDADIDAMNSIAADNIYDHRNVLMSANLLGSARWVVQDHELIYEYTAVNKETGANATIWFEPTNNEIIYSSYSPSYEYIVKNS